MIALEVVMMVSWMTILERIRTTYMLGVGKGLEVEGPVIKVFLSDD